MKVGEYLCKLVICSKLISFGMMSEINEKVRPSISCFGYAKFVKFSSCVAKLFASLSKLNFIYIIDT